MRVALAGNPNTGKTSLFNALTGSRAHVGNYPGITVESRHGSAHLAGHNIELIDVPGCYSLTARSPEEEVAHDVLAGRLDGDVDAIIVVVDASNLSRNLYLVQQLQELGPPLVVALNMRDVAADAGLRVDASVLAQRLGAPVAEIDARRGQGLDALSTALGKALEGQASQAQVVLAPSDASKIQQATDALQLSRGQVLWLLTSSPRLLARYPQHLELLSKLRQELAEPLADTPLADTPQTDTPLPFARRLIVARYAAVDAVARACVVPTQAPSGPSVTDRADRVLTHPVYGMALFMLFMVVLFQAIFAWSEPLIGAVEAAMGALAGGITGLLPEGVLQELVVDGLIAGVGNILVFLPQIILLFLAVAVMEESGYMARVATLLDRVMRRVGLSGKAFVPLLSSFACAVPGIMAARTISNTRDRLITILVAPLMSCSARLPVYTLVIATVFAGAQPVLGFMSLGGLMVTAMYFLGLFAAIGMAWLFRRTLLKGPTPPLLVELPTYKRPAARTVLLATARRAGVFVTQTGTVILALSVILWALMAYPRTSDDPQLRLQNSIAGTMGQAIEPLIEPLGFDWKIGIGLIGSFAAREVLVSTLGQVYGVGSDVDEESVVLREALTADIDPQTGKPRFTPLVGVSLMVFFVLAMQCLSTVATVRRETASWRWPIFMIVYMNALAWMASFATFQIGRALGLG